MPDGAKRVGAAALESFVAEIFAAAGTPAADAGIADGLGVAMPPVIAG